MDEKKPVDETRIFKNPATTTVSQGNEINADNSVYDVIKTVNKKENVANKLDPIDKKRIKREKADEKLQLSDVGQAVIGTVSQLDVSAPTMIMNTTKTSSVQKERIGILTDTKLLEQKIQSKPKIKQKHEFRKNAALLFKVFKFSKKHIWLLYLTFFVDILSIVFELMIPVFIGKSIDCVVGAGNVNFSGLLQNSIIIIALIVAVSCFNLLQHIFVNTFCVRTSKILREKMFDKIMNLPLSIIDNHQHGDLLTRMVNDVESITIGFLESTSTFISGILTIAGTVIFMFMLNLQLAFVVVLVTPLSLVFTIFIAKRSKVLFNKRARAQGDLSGFMEEYVSGQQVVKAFNKEEDSVEKFDDFNLKLYTVSEKAHFLSKTISPFTRFINGLAYGLVGLFGALIAIRGAISVGLISSFLTYANSFGKPFSQISDEISEIQSAFASARRLFEILEKEDEPSDLHLPAIEAVDGSVSIKKAKFSYFPNQKLIQNFNLEVKPGQKVAIVGPTGCGKTTMINLLMRFYDLTGGTIEISNHDVSKITRSSLRTKFGMVLQESWLFAGRIFDNIAYGKLDATKEEVVEAAKLAGAHEFIEKLKDGYDTIIDEGGTNVSQGQKQLICIARIMLIKPPMLILDEATSNIDTHTEMKIQEAFAVLMKGRTSFVIAHRLSTITNADIILVMNKGNIVEKGTHKELVEKKGFYANLYNSQFS